MHLQQAFGFIKKNQAQKYSLKPNLLISSLVFGENSKNKKWKQDFRKKWNSSSVQISEAMYLIFWGSPARVKRLVARKSTLIFFAEEKNRFLVPVNCGREYPGWVALKVNCFGQWKRRNLQARINGPPKGAFFFEMAGRVAPNFLDELGYAFTDARLNCLRGVTRKNVFFERSLGK